MIDYVDDAAGTFDHRCDICGLIRIGMRLDPASGDLTLVADAETGAVLTLVVRACPGCAAAGNLTTEHLRATIEAHEADEAPHPFSMAGHVFKDTGGVVIEHVFGGHPSTRVQHQLIRRMQRHPHLAPHAPLVELRPAHQRTGHSASHKKLLDAALQQPQQSRKSVETSSATN